MYRLSLHVDYMYFSPTKCLTCRMTQEPLVYTDLSVDHVVMRSSGFFSNDNLYMHILYL